ATTSSSMHKVVAESKTKSEFMRVPPAKVVAGSTENVHYPPLETRLDLRDGVIRKIHHMHVEQLAVGGKVQAGGPRRQGDHVGEQGDAIVAAHIQRNCHDAAAPRARGMENGQHHFLDRREQFPHENKAES